MNVPKLRFRTYNDVWTAQKLKSVCTFSKGKELSKADLSEEGEPCILYGELYTKYGEVIDRVISKTDKKSNSLIKAQKQDVLIPSSGETAIDIACASSLNVDSVLIGGDLNLLTPKDGINGHFLSYQINGKRKEKLSTLAQGATVTHLYADSIQKLECYFPTLNEQEQIANFLFTFDKKIQLQQEKIDLLKKQKKGFMQKIFSQELRFKDNNNQFFIDWKEVEFGDITVTFSGGTPSVSNRSYYTGNIPFIRSGEIHNDKTELYISELAINNSSAKMVENGDILYALYGATSGEVAISQIAGAINQAILCIRTAENKFFVKYWLENMKEKILSVYLQGGQGNLSASIIKSLKINLPHIDEQKTIASFFVTFDKKIQREENKLNSLIQQKQTFMQQMFI